MSSVPRSVPVFILSYSGISLYTSIIYKGILCVEYIYFDSYLIKKIIWYQVFVLNGAFFTVFLQHEHCNLLWCCVKLYYLNTNTWYLFRFSLQSLFDVLACVSDTILLAVIFSYAWLWSNDRLCLRVAQGNQSIESDFARI